MHYDVINTGNKVFNVIIPLISAKKSGPELDLRDYSTEEIGRYRYEPNAAILQGDNANHGTSAVHYMDEFRMGVAIYVGDLSDDSIFGELGFTQHYPPPEYDLLRSWNGIHWNPSDPSKKLPKPGLEHVMSAEADEKVGNACISA